MPAGGQCVSMATASEARLPRTFAQWYCIIGGATLLLAGVLGFAADATFDTGGDIDGDNFIVFEVNGWHNLVHIVSGLLLLAAANTRPTAKTIALTFGVVYGLVTLWGLVDGETVFGLLPVNGADNVLHLLLSAAAVAAALASPTTKGEQRRRRQGRRRGVDAPVTGGTVSGATRAPVGNDTALNRDEGRHGRTTREEVPADKRE